MTEIIEPEISTYTRGELSVTCVFTQFASG